MAFYLNRKVFENKFEDSVFTVVLGLLFGIIIIFFIIWNRLIREHFPKEITGEVYSIQFWIILVLFLYFISIVIFKIYVLQKQWRGIKSKNKYYIRFMEYLLKNPKLIDLLEFIRNYILNAPLYLWRFIYFNLRGKSSYIMKDFLYKSGSWLSYYCFDEETGKNKKQLIAMFLFVYGPKVLVFLIFFLEIVVNRRLQYFYFFAVLLLLPLIFLSLRRIYIDFSYYSQIFLQRTAIKLVPHPEIKGDFIIQKLNDSIPDHRYLDVFHVYIATKAMEKVTIDLFQIGEKYDSKVNFLTNIILAISFMFWLLVMLKVL